MKGLTASFFVALAVAWAVTPSVLYFALKKGALAQPRDRDVDRPIARVFVARARQEAVRLNRAGDYLAARRALEATAKRIRAYAGHDPELRAIVNELMREVEQFQQPMPERSLKDAYASSSYAMQSRAADGKARKSRA